MKVSHKKCELAAILFMLITWSKIKKTRIGKRASIPEERIRGQWNEGQQTKNPNHGH